MRLTYGLVTYGFVAYDPVGSPAPLAGLFRTVARPLEFFVTIVSPHLGTSADWTDARLLYALEEVVEKELNRHLQVAKDWMPHEYVPWSDARNFPGIFEDGEAWGRNSPRSPTSAGSPSW
ncbi:hypothetical protein SVIOM342S_09302 [Streptomyces violaceorubidus]